MEKIKIDIKNYYPINKNVLRASFTLIIHPHGQKILDCKYFVGTDGARWIAFPQKEIKHSDGRKSEYIPIVSYEDKEYLNNLKASALEILSKYDQRKDNGETHASQDGTESITLSGEAPPIW